MHHRRVVPFFAAAALLCLAYLGCAGCGGGRVPVEYRPQERLETWSDAEWAAVLDEVATEHGFVRWDRIENNTDGVRDRLYRYVGQLGAASPENRPDLFPSDQDKLAYYINAYNALCMYGVIERGYPGNVLRPGVIDPGALFYLDKFVVGGKSYTLNGLEREEVLDASGRDPRMHFAVNCMSFSCPPLRREPYRGDRLAEQLNEQGEVYLSDPRAAVPDDGGKTVRLNRIFTSYYRDDFTAGVEAEGDAAVLAGVRRYAAQDSPVVGATNLQGLGYDWSLNRPPEQWPPR